MSDHLLVQAGAEPVGSLDRSDVDRRNSLFTYAPVAPDHAISLVMPVRRDPYQWDRGIHPIFEMNLPEGELRAVLMRQFSKVTANFDDLSLLALVGPHQLGRVTVGEPQSEGALPAPIDLKQLMGYHGTEDLVEYLIHTYARFSGVSGVQPKVLVHDSETAAMERITQRTATHIVKAWRADQYPQLAANEYFCLRAAELAGCLVPEFELSEDGKLLVVKRFDLPSGGQYLGFEDLCALAGWSSVRKYEGSYEGCAKQLKAFVSPDRLQEAMEQFFMAVALSCALQNGDAHRKNFGVLYRSAAEDNEVWMAPVYDIVTTTAYLPRDSMALLLGGSKRWPKAEMLRRFGRAACGLSERTVARLLDQVGAGMADALAEMKVYASQEPAFADIADRMAASWNEGCRHSLALDDAPRISPGTLSPS